MPVDYSADALFTLGTLRAAQNGHVTPLARIAVPELGAPHVASWNRFLRQHKPQYWLAGRLARWIGLFPAANLAVLLAAVLAALSFHAVARYLGRGRSGPSPGACAFALSPFFFYRSLTHLTLSHYWPIPPAILVVSWAFTHRGVVPRSRRFWLAAAVVVVAGFHNIYFAAVLAQFLGARGARAARHPALVAGRPRRARAARPALRVRAGGQRQPAAAARPRGLEPRLDASLTATSSATR